RPAPLAYALLVDPALVFLALRDLAGRLPEEVGDTPLEPAQSRFARVLADHEPERLVGDRHPLLDEPVRLELLGNEVALRDLQLLVLGIARQLDHVHAVE